MDQDPRSTSIADRHRDLGARFVEFAGWEMPIRYGSLLEEHRAVRDRAGLFDVSHMGEIWVSGAEADTALAYALVSDPATLALGRAEYSLICAPDGGIIDDLIVYRPEVDRYLVVANASNADVVRTELAERMDRFDARVEDSLEETAMVAIQGPKALSVLARTTKTDVSKVRYYSIVPATVAGHRALIARTGYTGEDGFEVFARWEEGPRIWDALLAAGEPDGLVPVGLGARDTLRLEAGMPLYGNEMDRETTPFEAGIGHVVKFSKPGTFVGRQALLAAKDNPRRHLVGLVLRGRSIARHGDLVFVPGTDLPCGVVTSGAPSPTLGAPIALATVHLDDGREPEPGDELEVSIREERVPAETVTLPFYRRSKAKNPGGH